MRKSPTKPARRSWRWSRAGAVASLLGALGLTVALAVPAGASVTTIAQAAVANTTVTTTLVDVRTGMCLDGNSSGAVYTHSCNGGNYQKWRQIWTSQGFVMESVATGSCLYDFYISANLYGVRTAPCNYNAGYQNFHASQWAGYNLYLPNDLRQAGTWCLDSNFGSGGLGNVYEDPCNGGEWQHWISQLPA
jgi:hypothetical protein